MELTSIAHRAVSGLPEPAPNNSIGVRLGVNPFLRGARYRGLVYDVSLRWIRTKRGTAYARTREHPPFLPAFYRYCDRVESRHAETWAVWPVNLLYRIRRLYWNARWNVFDWLIAEGYLVGPECGYFYEYSIAWPQRWT